MKEDLIRAGDVTRTYTANHRHNGYQVELWHDGLSEHCVLKAADRSVLHNKVAARRRQWTDKWERIETKRDAEQKRSEAKRHAAAQLQASLDAAAQRSQEAEQQLAEARALLTATLAVHDAVDWDSLKDQSPFVFSDQQRFPGVNFDPRGHPVAAQQRRVPSPPSRQEARFQPKLTLLDRMFPGRKAKRLQEADQLYAKATQRWQQECTAIEEENQRHSGTFEAARTAYQSAEQEFLTHQRDTNRKIDQLHDRYRERDPEAVVQNCELVLNASTYPDFVSKDFVVNYEPETHILVVDYELPPPSALPALTKVSYVKARDEMKETHLSEKQIAQLYDDVLYQIALRTLHELFEADTAEAIDHIGFNGWVEDINTATGNPENACVMSLQVSKAEFLAINLANVNPKACFKKLKGVAAATLTGLAPVKPLLQLTTDDQRFVASYEVASTLEAGTNLAAIPWEDFEHLVRELFEKEFSGAGGEVKVTRASADGGVDAVVFDPDPIRGGKLIIQAKRYTNTVGVAAVRDLYGTVINEGANKGILVTTADYGPDSYTFAQDKPLTLLNGSNLLHLLAKHGHPARIDLREAKAATHPSS